MKVHLLTSATNIIEANGVKILSDPWLVDGEYYGSWAHYPPYEFVPDRFEDIDFIYISHIHPDHLSKLTLVQFKKDIPVLIHAYRTKFLRSNIEAMGFKVVELPHNQRTHLKNGVHINVLAADNCNPSLCGRFFGCARLEKRFGLTQIDSLSVVDDGSRTVVNVNDCPFGLAHESTALLRRQYRVIDLLLTGYTGAGPYPQCFPKLPLEELGNATAAKKIQFLAQGEAYINELSPRYYIPFAGTYTLSGKLAALNPHRGVAELYEAVAYYSASENIDHNHSKCAALRPGGFVDLCSGEIAGGYLRDDPEAKRHYISKVLAARPLDYESQEIPPLDELRRLVPAACERVEKKRREIGLETKTDVIVYLGEDLVTRVSMNGDGWEFANPTMAERRDRYVSYKTDPRLLLQILKGPRFAHWNNAEIGSHIQFDRQPNDFERGLYHVMNFFHA